MHLVRALISSMCCFVSVFDWSVQLLSFQFYDTPLKTANTGEKDRKITKKKTKLKLNAMSCLDAEI